MKWFHFKGRRITKRKHILSNFFETIQKEIDLRGMLKMKDEDQSKEVLLWGDQSIADILYFLTCLGLGGYRCTIRCTD
jgi:hypothetical protein